MKTEDAKVFAEREFKVLGELSYSWNMFHIKYMIKAIEEIGAGSDVQRLTALAWVHDVGKIEGMEDHAKKSVAILEKVFDLDEIDKDCILNHGSSGVPLSEEGKIFRYADGMSLFYPEIVMFRFFAEAKEGKTFDEVKEMFRGLYEKYMQSYSDNQRVCDLIKKRYQNIFPD